MCCLSFGGREERRLGRVLYECGWLRVWDRFVMKVLMGSGFGIEYVVMKCGK